MPQDNRDDLLTYLVDKVEGLIRQAATDNPGAATDLLAEAQELLALHANIERRRRHAAADVQLRLPFERQAA